MTKFVGLRSHCPTLAVALMVVPLALAVDGAAAQARPLGTTQEQKTQTNTREVGANELTARDRLIGDIWGLSHEEMARAKVLLQGPRANFSVENLSPVEALGIHARSDAERRKYAEMFARAFHADVERSLAWNSAYQEAIGRLYPNEPIVDFRGLPKVNAPVGSADAMNVPRSMLIEGGAPSSAQPVREQRR
ncbi:hypothetical protein NU688_32810 [Variovorax sp. ZS18.2.2]|uniref:hypothetical protein n=1 Tax=Variovorax sp. ZS18.2.2 TaxID=2971255 RepID=UPI002151A43C|nr:hypothetical protein [Variovorax sp. ZS18.2.2]MCR6480978.1 hypothetical protein [Variovorax sp. ZS18.2.2]